MMCKKIFITATNTDIGKTYTTQMLLESYTKMGYRVGVIKPIETGVVDRNYPDGEVLLHRVKKLNPDFTDVSLEDIVPISYPLASAPYIASGGKKIDFELIDQKIKKLERLCDILLIEGAGGLYVPIEQSFMMIDFIKRLDVVTLLVTHCSLGCINDTLLSEKALTSYNISYISAFNCRAEDSAFEKISQPYFKQTRQKVLKVTQDIDTLSELLYNL